MNRRQTLSLAQPALDLSGKLTQKLKYVAFTAALPDVHMPCSWDNDELARAIRGGMKLFEMRGRNDSVFIRAVNQ